MKGGKTIKSIRKKAAGALLLLFFAAAALACTVSAAETALWDLAQPLSGGTWVKNSKGRRYRKADGKFVKNAWISVEGKIYRIGPDRYAETGWFTVDGGKYHAGSAGSVCYGKWLTLKQKKYYFPVSGACVRNGWYEIGQKYYYFNKNGKLLTDCFIGDYYVDASGIRSLSSGWIETGGKRYYLDSSGKRVKNKWIKKSGKFYYMLSDGAMAVNSQVGQYFAGWDGARMDIVPESISGRYIFVGDSRMVGMSQVVPQWNAEFIALDNSGYKWLEETAGPELQRRLSEAADAENIKVILAHGVNDPGNISLYVTYYRKLMNKYPEVSFYVLSVNPLEYASKWITNDMIKSFNKTLKTTFRSNYFDTFTYLEESGFETKDGIHYTAAVNQKIYSYIIRGTR